MIWPVLALAAIVLGLVALVGIALWQLGRALNEDENGEGE